MTLQAIKRIAVKSRLTAAKQRAFTRLELLIVLAVIALLCAILIPIEKSNRNRKDQASCQSQERRIASAISQYVQDNDQTYPWSYSLSEDTPSWPDLVLPYAKERSKGEALYSCPSGGTPAASYSTNGQLIGLFDIAHKSPAKGWYGSVVKASRVTDPHETILLGDGILSTFIDASLSTPGRRAANDFAYPHPANTTDHTSDKGWDASWLGLSTNNHQISWRHGGGANFVFCDGHAAYSRPGELKDANWDVRCRYGQKCEGNPNGPVYPAPDGSCGNQSPIDCQ